MNWINVVQALLIGSVPLGVAYITGLFNQKGKSVDATATPYNTLAERVTYLEKQQVAFQLWISLVLPIHADITARWGYYRAQKEPPTFPPYPASKEEEV